MIKLSGIDPLIIASPLSDIATRKSLGLLRSQGLEHLKGLPTSRREKSIMRQAKEDYGVESGYAYVPKLSRGNSMFISSDNIKEYMRRNADLDPKIMKALTKNVGKHGLVVAGKGWKKPGVVEHEFGHAIAQEGGSPLEKLVHKPWVDDYERYYHTIPSHIVGGATGRFKGGAAGMLAGALAGLAFGSPRIYREMIADKYGKKLMTEKDKARTSSWPFLGSYIAQAAVPATVTGGVVGGASQLLKLLRKAKR
jgi:hypothetical protein